MKDNGLANFTLTPMSAVHFELASKNQGSCNFSEVAIKAVRAVLVDGLDPEVAPDQFSVPRKEFYSALKSYSATWERYCQDNELTTGVFWLPPEVIALAKELENRTLLRIERDTEK